MATLRFLLLEAKLQDTEAIQAALTEGGIDYALLRVDTRAAFVRALETNAFDLILAAYAMPGLAGMAALELARGLCPDVPFIFVSDSLGEELAIEALKQGATDYVLKQRLGRLVPCIQRALRETQEHHNRKQAERLLVEQKQLLELIASGRSLDDCLAAVCAAIAQLNPHVRASFLLADAQRQSFPRAITPDFPPSFGQGLKDAPINDLCIGTCGEAVYRGQPVSCADMAHDDRWSSDWRALCVAHGVLACHSTPVLGADGLPLGALMLAFDEARLPTEWEYQLANFGVQVASLAFERDRANLALHQNEARLRTVAANLPNGAIFVVDRELRYLLAEGSALQNAGITSKTLVGKTLLEALDPTLASRYEPHYRQALEGEPFSLEHCSHDRYYISHGTPLCNDQGEVDTVLVVSYDISDRVRNEAARRESEAKYRTLFESIDEGFCIVEVLFAADGTATDHRILQANAAFERHTGILDPIGKTASELAPGIEQYWNDLYAQVIQTGETVRMENRSDALDRWFDVLIWRVGEASNGQVAIVFTDITERKRAGAWLQASHDTFRHLVETSPFGVYTVDADFRLAQVSAGAQKIFANIRPLLGRDFAEILRVLWTEPFASEAIARFRHTLETGEPYHSLSTIERRHDINAIESYDWKLERLTLLDGRFGVVCHFYDLSERQHYEAALRESEERFRLMADTVPQIVWLTDAEGQVEFFNKQWSDYTGVPYERTTAAAVAANFVHPDDGAKTMEAFDEARRVGGTFKVEHRIRSAAGLYRWFLVRAEPYRDPQTGEIIRWFGASLDIHDRKLAEAALQETSAELARQLQRFDAIATAVPDFIYTFDRSGRFTYSNQQLLNLLQRTSAEVLGKNFFDLEYPTDLATRLQDQIQQVIETRQLLRDETPFTSAFGDHVYEYIFVPLFDVNGAVEAVAGVSRDITDRKLAEAALQESESRFRLMVESAKEYAIFTLDLEGTITSWNSGAERLLGYSEAAIVGRSGRIIFTPEDAAQGRHEREMHLALTQGQAENERWHVRQDGSRFWGSGLVMPMQDEAGTTQGFVKIMQDKTAQRRSEAEREQLLQREQAAREEAERANRLKDEFLAVLSHELRSPLNPILGWSRLLQNGRLDETRQAEALQTIERNAKLQAQLIEDLLDISRIMQGKLSLTAAPVSLTFVIMAAVETVRLAVEAKHIQLTLDLPTIAPISGDVARLQQVVWNLLTNAVKFTPNDRQITVELRQIDQLAQIRVIDTGRGIQPQFLPHVFEYFRQEDGSTTRRFGGLGLGLAIVRQIVEMHGGTVWAESEGENQGATFIVQLPTMPQAAALDSEPVRTQAETAAPLDTLQILLVDDDTDTREFQTFLLEQNGATVTAVDSGLAALQALEQLTPAVIVSDIGMATMDGYMLLQQVRSRPPHQGGTIPAIALTAYAAELDQQKAFQAGFQAHITKPVEPEVLVQAIVNLLQEKSANKR